eukprot:2523547-Amphidinium_carterae.1
MPFDQWEQRNAEAWNSDEFGFGLEDDRDIDQLFDESGLHGMQSYRVKRQLIMTRILPKNLKVTMLQDISLTTHDVQSANVRMDRSGDTGGVLMI